MKVIHIIFLWLLIPTISFSQNYNTDSWKQAYLKGSYSDAMNKINDILNQNPYLSHLVYYRAMCHKNLQNYTASLADINSYLQKTENIIARFEKASILFELGYNESAFKEYLNIKQNYGDLEQLKLPMARYYLYKNKPGEAKLLMRELYGQDPNNSDLLWLLSLSNMYDNKPQDALNVLKSSINNGLRNVQKLEEVVEYAKINGYFELSLFALEECIKIAPENPVYYYKKQSLLELLNKHEEAKKCMIKGQNLLEVKGM